MNPIVIDITDGQVRLTGVVQSCSSAVGVRSVAPTVWHDTCSVISFPAKTHALRRIADVDARRVTGYQDFVDEAPLDLIYVSNRRLAVPVPHEQRDIYAAACAGAIAQNVYLFCAAEGLAAVVRGWFDRAALGKVARLGPKQRVLLTQTVGYPRAA